MVRDQRCSITTMKVSYEMKIFLFVILAFSGTFASGQNPESVPAVKSACGPKKDKYEVRLSNRHPKLEPANGKAVIYVIQDIPQIISSFFTPASTTRISLDGSWVGANKRRSYSGFYVKPGVHHLCVSGQWSGLFEPASTSLYRFAAKPGDVYYFRVRLLSSYPGPHLYIVDLEPVDEDEGAFLLQTSAHSTSHPE